MGSTAEKVIPGESSPGSRKDASPFRKVSRQIIHSDRGNVTTEMIISRKRLRSSERVMEVLLKQQTSSGPAAFRAELSEKSDDNCSIRGQLELPEKLTQFFTGQPLFRYEGAKVTEKQKIWEVIAAFLDEGAGAAEYLLKSRFAPVAALSTGANAKILQRPIHLKPERTLKTALGALVMLFNSTEGASLHIVHNSNRWGDQLAFVFDTSDTEDDVRLAILNSIVDELSDPDENAQQRAIIDLAELTVLEQGKVLSSIGNRHLLAQQLHDSIYPHVVGTLDRWVKGPVPKNAPQAFDMLRHGIELETLRRKNAEYDFFSEMELALAPSPYSDRSYFVLKNDQGLRLRFNIPPMPSPEGWLKLMSSLIRHFAHRPEILIEVCNDWIVDPEDAPFPLTVDMITAYRHVLRLFQAEDSVLPQEELRKSNHQRAVRTRGSAFELTTQRAVFGRSPHKITLRFKITVLGIESVTVSKSGIALGRQRVFSLAGKDISDKVLLNIFDSFHHDRDLATTRKRLRDTALYQYLLELSAKLSKRETLAAGNAA